MALLTDRDQGGGKPYGLIPLCLSTIGILGLAIGIAALAGVAAALIDAALFGWRPTIDRIIEVSQALQANNSTLGLRADLVLSIVLYGAIIVAILAFAHWRGGPAWRELVAWRPLAVKASDRWIWAIVVAALIYSLAAPFLFGQFEERAHLSFKVPADLVSALVVAILAVVVAPLTEELLFRGWIYTGLHQRFGTWTAVIASSVVFALAHYEDTHIYALAVFPVGLALGGLRARTGSVKAPILFHAFYNFLAVVISLLE